MADCFQQQVNKCLMCARPLCKDGCPLHNCIPEVIGHIRKGNYAQAVLSIGHPFGEICGYVCPHENACQGACVLGRKGEPVLISAVERELFATHPYVVERRANTLQGKRYAVVGGGIAGLTFASKVYEQGADVTVYEQDELLSTIKLIPKFRLPLDAILRAQQTVQDKFNIICEQIDSERLKTLQAQFDGVYVATGLTLDYGLGVEGQALATNYRDCLKGNYTRGTVVVVGGGNSAMDCARLTKSHGCKVVVAYRRTQSDMPAFAKEINEAKSEGVEFMFNVAPTKLTQSNGKLILTLAKTVNEGRGKLIVTNDTFDLDCNSVIAAIGSKFDNSVMSAERNAEQFLQYDNVYLGGDAKGGRLVVHAVSDGLTTANLIIEKARRICL